MKKDKLAKRDYEKANAFRYTGEMKKMAKESGKRMLGVLNVTNNSLRGNKAKTNIVVVSTNEEKIGTCGSCIHTDNDLGFVALHCMELNKEADRKLKADPEFDSCDYDKVRSWHKCHFDPSRFRYNLKDMG